MAPTSRKPLERWKEECMKNNEQVRIASFALQTVIIEMFRTNQ